jgi:hypothetical protein
MTFSVRFLNHGVMEDVDVEGGEGEVVVRSIWTASLSYLSSSISGLGSCGGLTRQFPHPLRSPNISTTSLQDRILYLLDMEDYQVSYILMLLDMPTYPLPEYQSMLQPHPLSLLS